MCYLYSQPPCSLWTEISEQADSSRINSHLTPRTHISLTHVSFTLSSLSPSVHTHAQHNSSLSHKVAAAAQHTCYSDFFFPSQALARSPSAQALAPLILPPFTNFLRASKSLPGLPPLPIAISLCSSKQHAACTNACTDALMQALPTCMHTHSLHAKHTCMHTCTLTHFLHTHAHTV